MSPQLIETLRVAADGAIPLLAQHLARLTASSRALDYACDPDEVCAALQHAAAKLPRGSEYRLRLLLDRHGALKLTSAILPALPAAPRIVLARERLHSETIWLRHKTTHRPWFEAASAWLAQQADVFDVLYANEHGQLCEGTRSNVYLKLDGQWFTPPVAVGLLPGVQRAQLLASGQVAERVLQADELKDAQGLRVSNALRGWFEVGLEVRL